jgi:hypothetical protein
VLALGPECRGGRYTKDVVSFPPARCGLYCLEYRGALTRIPSMACAIREAYAATITVVIMVDSRHDSELEA